MFNATEIFNARVNVVDELNVTSDTVMGYPNDTGNFFDEIRHGENTNGDNLTAAMVPYAVLFFLVLFAVAGALCTAGYCGCKKIIKEWRKGSKKDTLEDTDEAGPFEISLRIIKENEEVDATKSTPPPYEMKDSSEDSVWTITRSHHKAEYIPQDRSYFL